MGRIRVYVSVHIGLGLYVAISPTDLSTCLGLYVGPAHYTLQFNCYVCVFLMKWAVCPAIMVDIANRVLITKVHDLSLRNSIAGHHYDWYEMCNEQLSQPVRKHFGKNKILLADTHGKLMKIMRERTRGIAEFLYNLIK